MHNYFRSFLVWIFIFLVSGLSAQDTLENGLTSSSIILQEVKIEVAGWTSLSVLKRRLDLKEGRIFASEIVFNTYLDDLRQQLQNLRTISEFTLSSEFLDSEKTKSIILITVKDGWSIVALPYFKYDTNTGLTASIRGREYNFLGTMEPLRVNMDYRYDQSARSFFLLETDINLPFEFQKLNWTWSFLQSLDIRMEQDWGWRGDTSLSVGWEIIPGITGSLKLSEALKVNELETNGLVETPFKNANTISYGTSFLLAESFLGLKKPAYNPTVFLTANTEPGDAIKTLVGVDGGFYHSLTAGRVDWNSNLRSGAQGEISQRLSYRILDQVWDTTQEVVFQLHLPFHYYWWNLGLSSRLGAWTQGSQVRTEAGSKVRGIVDKRISSFWGTYINLEMPFTVMFWKPTDWWGWSWAKFSQFEMMFSPILDVAFADAQGTGLGTDDIWTGGGLEVLIFSDFIKSFFIRASLAYDLQAVIKNRSLSLPSPLDQGEIREISFGLGFFY